MTRSRILIALTALALITLVVLTPIKNPSMGKASPSKSPAEISRSQEDHVTSNEVKSETTVTNIEAASEDVSERDESIDVTEDLDPETPWIQPLTETLRAQGGSALKSIRVQKVESKKMLHEGQEILGETVRIILKNDKNEETSFKALIDSSTGEILKSWDRPVRDAVNPRDDFGIQLDSRHLNHP